MRSVRGFVLRAPPGWLVCILVGLGPQGCAPQESGDGTDEPRNPGPGGALAGPWIDATHDAGLSFLHEPGTPGSYFFPEIMGSGAALFDYDGDGDFDIFLVNGTNGPPHPLAETTTPESGTGPSPTNRLYRQEADGTFADVTSGSGLDEPAYGTGVAVGDVNNDGRPDLYVAAYGPDRLFLNLGNGTFADVTEEAGIDNLRWGTSACFLDYDRDGWLDLFVTNYVDYYPSRRCAGARGRQDYCHPSVFSGTPDKLYRNATGELADERRTTTEGTAAALPRFCDESLSSGIALRQGPGLGAVSADFNGDGWPDIYVANDSAANFLWLNQHDGTFREAALLEGCAYSRHGQPQASMGIALGDLNGDERLDIFLTHLFSEYNTLYLSGEYGFEDASAEAGLAAPSLPFTGFGTAMFDLEHDGDLDIAVVNGRVMRSGSERGTEGTTGGTASSGGTAGLSSSAVSHAPASADFWTIYAETNQFFVNDGTGRFHDASAAAGALTARREVSRGLACGDVDDDGDIDLLVSNIAGPARLFLNTSEKQGAWLQVRAVDPTLGGRDAYGATVIVSIGRRRLLGYVNPGYSYQSSNDPRVHFGLGPVERIDAIEIIWPDGVRETFAGGPANVARVLRRGEGA